jgi:uncharacterized protein
MKAPIARHLRNSDKEMTDVPGSVAVTGASGFVGSAVVSRLRREGFRVLRMVRREARGPDEVFWDPDAGRIDGAALAGAAAVVHLAGETIAQRWTVAAKRRIAGSRVQGTRLLAEALAGLSPAPPVLVAASAVGLYGANRGDHLLPETASAGTDFLAGVVRGWEEAAGPARAVGVRVVHLRYGLVLSRRGGALGRMLLPFRMGVGGRIGSGRQWMSWIALDDVAELVVRAIRDSRMHGAYNATAGAVTNAEFTRTLGRVMHRPAILPVPAAALKLVFGSEMVEGTLLASQRSDPARLRELGHRFIHPELEGALRAAVQPGG